MGSKRMDSQQRVWWAPSCEGITAWGAGHLCPRVHLPLAAPALTRAAWSTRGKAVLADQRWRCQQGGCACMCPGSRPASVPGDPEEVKDHDRRQETELRQSSNWACGARSPPSAHWSSRSLGHSGSLTLPGRASDSPVTHVTCGEVQEPLHERGEATRPPGHCAARPSRGC